MKKLTICLLIATCWLTQGQIIHFPPGGGGGGGGGGTNNPTYTSFDTDDFIAVAPNVAIANTIARINDTQLTGNTVVENFSTSFARIVPVVYSNVTNSQTVTLSVDSNYYVITNSSSAYTIALPVSMPDCTVIIEATSTSAIDAVVITLPNAAVWPESGSQTAISSFAVVAGSNVKYDIALVIVNGTVNRYHADGVVFPVDIAANQVSFTAGSGISSTNVQSAVAELAGKAAVATNLSQVATSGSYADLSGTPPLANDFSVYASGTAYSITTTSTNLDFGTTDPTLTISSAGTYRLFARVSLKYNAATFAASRTVTLKLRRNNNTPADIANTTITLATDIITTKTYEFAVATLPMVGYTTANANDQLMIFASIDTGPTAGSLDAIEAQITATRINAFSVQDASPPTLVSATIPAAGTTVSLVFNETVQIGAGGNGGFVMTPSGAAVTMTYDSGSGTSTLLYNLSRTIAIGETATLAYTQPGNGVEDLSGNDLANFSGTSVTNNSTDTGFSAKIAVLDGTNDYMTTSTGGTGWADATSFTCSFWAKFNGGDASLQGIARNGNARFIIEKDANNKIHLQAKSTGGTTLLDITGTNSLTSASGWKHIYICINLTDSAKRKIYINGASETLNITTYTSGTMDLNNASMRWGAGASGLNKCNATFAEVWLASVYLDDTTKFSDGTHPISLGPTGNTPNGTSPAFYWSLSGDGDTWATDSSGNGNNGTVTGAFGSSDTRP